MADIELVIKIDEEIYKHILSMQFYIPGSRSGKSLLEKILKAIRTGTPLPKGHGDLVDVTSIPNEDRNITVKSLLAPHSIACIGAITLDEYINNLPTIIEAE